MHWLRAVSASARGQCICGADAVAASADARLPADGICPQMHWLPSQMHGCESLMHGRESQIHGCLLQMHGCASQMHGCEIRSANRRCVAGIADALAALAASASARTATHLLADARLRPQMSTGIFPKKN
jgi:hypothetical protein